MNCWVDIRNLKAKVPIINRVIRMKVLITPNKLCSKLFTKYIEACNSSPVVEAPSKTKVPVRKAETDKSAERGTKPKLDSFGDFEDFEQNTKKVGQSKIDKTKKPNKIIPNRKGSYSDDNLAQTIDLAMKKEDLNLRNKKNNMEKTGVPEGLEALIMAEAQNNIGLG